MPRHLLTIDLRDDPAAIEAYCRHHERVWPEVERSLREAGIREMTIHRLGRRLVMTLDLEDGVEPEQAFARHEASGPGVAEWERLMRTLQQPAPGARGGEGWSRMDPVYRLPAGGDPGARPR